MPAELDEAATMDGANLFQILTNVVIPNSLTGLLTVSLIEFQFIWNEFYWPLVAISSKDLMPVQVAIATQFTERDPQWGRVFAAMVVASLPIIILFMALQRYFYQSAAMADGKMVSASDNLARLAEFSKEHVFPRDGRQQDMSGPFVRATVEGRVHGSGHAVRQRPPDAIRLLRDHERAI